MDQTTIDKVLGQVDEAAIVELASDLIRIPSFKPDETAVAKFLEGFFQERGYQVDLQEVEPGRFQTIATLPGSGGGCSLMLNGHTDINSLTRRWTRDPWTPTVEGDRLYGHGIQNMKGGLASIIMAAEAVRQSQAEMKGDLVVACVVGETQGGEGTHFLMESGMRTDMAVVAEPFGAHNLVTVHCGVAHMAIHTYGITGHIRQVESTVNAIYMMNKVIDRLQQVQFTHQPRQDMEALPRLNVGGIIGGLGTDYVLVEPPYVPDICTIIVDVHFVPGTDGGQHTGRPAPGPRPSERRGSGVGLRDRNASPRVLQGKAAVGDEPLGCAAGHLHSRGGGAELRGCCREAAPSRRVHPALHLHRQRHLPPVGGGHPLPAVRAGRSTRQRRRRRQLRHHQRNGPLHQSAGPHRPGGVQSGTEVNRETCESQETISQSTVIPAQAGIQTHKRSFYPTIRIVRR